MRAPVEPNPTEALKEWHARADAQFVELAKARKLAPDPVESRVILSYAIRTQDREHLDPAKLMGFPNPISQELNDFLPGSSLFYPYRNETIAPSLQQDIQNGEPRGEFVQCAIWQDMPYLLTRTEFWRVSSDGKATHIRPFPEDTAGLNPNRRKWLSPLLLARALAELARHAYLLSQKFSVVDSIEFRCEWVGLADREIWDSGVRGFFYYPGQTARADRAITVDAASPSELLADWPKTVSKLGAPVRRLFNPSADFSPEWVAKQNLAV
jgi:hypothetical protein